MKHRPRLYDLIVIMGGIIVVVLLTFLIYPKFASIGTDGSIYAITAQNIATGNGLTIFGHPQIYFSPLLSFSVVPFYWIMGNIDLAAHMAMIIFGLAIIPIFYICAKRLFGQSVAWISVLFLVLNGAWVWRNTLRLSTQSITGLLTVLLLFILITIISAHYDRSSKLYVLYGLAGLVSGITYLGRPEYFFLPIPLLLFIWLWNHKNVRLNTMLGYAGIFLAFFATMAVPYIFYLHSNIGQWTISGRLSEQFLVATHASLENAHVVNPPVFSENPIILIFKHASDFAKLYFENLLGIEHSLVSVFGAIGFILFGIGLWQCIREKKYKELLALAVPTVMICALALGHTGDNGYITAFVYPFIILMAMGAYTIFEGLGHLTELSLNARRTILVAIIAVSSLYFVFPIFQNYFFQPEGYKPAEYMELGEWFKSSIPQAHAQAVAARKPEIAFYTGTTWYEISSDQSLDYIIVGMRAVGTNYLAIDTRSMGVNAERLIKEISADANKRMTLVKEFKYYKNTVYLYFLKH